MNNLFFDSVPERQRTRSRSHRQRPERSGRSLTEDGFLCKHCNNFVSTAWFLSSVQNRNHCPYCLWSRHLDLFEAGDRLSACKAPMRPAGLTLKATHKKYGPGQGELMLIHLCTECEHLSINRIAADDIPENVYAVFEGSFGLDGWLCQRLEVEGIAALSGMHREQVYAQLFGGQAGLAEMLLGGRMTEMVNT